MEQPIIRMTVAIEIRRASQPPTGRKCRAEHAANKSVIIQIPDRCLTRRRIADHKVRMAVAVKVSYYSRTLYGHAGRKIGRCWRFDSDSSSSAGNRCYRCRRRRSTRKFLDGATKRYK